MQLESKIFIVKQNHNKIILWNEKQEAMNLLSCWLIALAIFGMLFYFIFERGLFEKMIWYDNLFSLLSIITL